MITDNEPLPVAGGCFLIATADGSNPNYATRC